MEKYGLFKLIGVQRAERRYCSLRLVFKKHLLEKS